MGSHDCPPTTYPPPHLPLLSLWGFTGSACWTKISVGILLILASCLVQGAQYVFEEKVMSVDDVPPLAVVGLEGFWGAVIMPLVVFPWLYIIPGSDYGGSMENVYDSWIMLRNSRQVQLVLLGFFLTVAGYNMLSIYVTYLLSSIWHAILDNFRPISVWGADLALYYVVTARIGGNLGEPWTFFSYIELAGMLVLFIGTAVYNGSIKLCCFHYADVDTDSGGTMGLQLDGENDKV